MIELATLYARSRNGAITQWRVYNSNDIVVTEFGKLGGKQTKHQDRVRSTNEGRSNARIGEAQAEFEAKAAWDKKLREGYFTSVEEAQSAIVLLPMLAHPLEKKAKRNGKDVKIEREVNWNHCWIQPKLNGLRGLTLYYSPDFGLFKAMANKPESSQIVIRSREGEDWDTLAHIKAELDLMIKPGDVVDGEVYVHGVPLQILNSHIKRLQPETRLLQYHLYDYPSRRGTTSATWKYRWHDLRDAYIRYVTRRLADQKTGVLASKDSSDVEQAVDGLCPNTQLEMFIKALPLQLVPTYSVTDRGQARDLQQKFIAAGFEGAIIRADDRPYEFNDRCEGLLKLKDFEDAEFEILKVHSRELIKDGISSTIVDKFEFKNDINERTFEAVPRGTLEQRAAWWQERDELVGKFGVVRFLERSVDGLPQGNPVMTSFRLEEDRGQDEGKMW
jgi:DNA ligase-1